MNAPTDIRHSENSALSQWLRRFFSCNPLYLASAGLLLYGINQVSSDASLAGAEPAQITFNFAALFIYEILLVWTAIMLAQRAIWYDALLLVALENLFVLVPFSLVSRAVQLDEALGQKLCAAAVLLAGMKFWALRRYIPRLNLSPRLLGFGALAMGANAALALGLRQIYTDTPAVNSWLTFGWLLGLPLLIALGNFLPKPAAIAKSPQQDSWLPNAALGIWIAVTGCHLGGVGYVYTFKWTLALLAPSLWALAWTLVLQTKALGANSVGARSILVSAPLLVTVLAADDLRLCFALNLLNVAGFAWAWWRHRERGLLWLGAIAFVICVVALPVEWMLRLVPGLGRAEWAGACLLTALISVIIVSRNPKWTIVGGGLACVAAALAMNRTETPFQWAAQGGLMFCIAHSMRWRDEAVAGARTARLFFCVAWTMQSFLWSLADEHEALIGCSISGGAVLACYGLQRWLGGNWKTPLIPAAATTVLLSAPGSHLVERLKSTSPGYLAVAVSFLLFGFGTAAALTKHRWQKQQTN